MNEWEKNDIKRQRDYHESKGHQLATYDDMHVGQLVSGVRPGSGGIGGYGKVHWFNHRGCFIGNDTGFIEWGDIYLHHNGKVFLQVRHGYSKWIGLVKQWQHEATCKVATFLMKMAYVD